MDLLEYRIDRDKTQQQCADELNISKEYYAELERGVHKPSRKLCEKIVEWSEKKITYAELWDWR